MSERPEGFTVEELMGSLRDGDVTVLGELIGVTDLCCTSEPCPKCVIEEEE